jgi:hypothetical protein
MSSDLRLRSLQGGRFRVLCEGERCSEAGLLWVEDPRARRDGSGRFERSDDVNCCLTNYLAHICANYLAHDKVEVGIFST